MFTTLLLPNFYLQAALRQRPELHERPVALIDGEEAKAKIMQLNAAAEQTGIVAGLTPTQGLARCLQLEVMVRDRAQEQALAEIALDLAFTLSPDVEATAPGVYTVQFSETRRLEENVRRVVAQFAGQRLMARAGIAHNGNVSLLAAHLAKPVLRVGDTRTFLAALPIETLALAVL
jgi:protein ImuB